MSTVTSFNTYTCEGSLAVTPQPVAFRVLEGGQSPRVQRSNQMRFLGLIATIALVLSVIWIGIDVHHDARVNAAFTQTAYQTVTVMPGTTLWQLAEAHPVEGCSTSEVVRHLRSINHLSSASLSVGMRLSVPVADNNL